MKEWQQVTNVKIPKSKIPANWERMSSEVWWGDGQCYVRVTAKVDKGPEDVTESIKAQLVKSNTSDGYYIALMYEGKQIAGIGIEPDTKEFAFNKGFRLVKVAHSRMSFRVVKD